MNKRINGIVILIILTSQPIITNGLDSGFFAGIPHKIVNGIYISICNEMCFDAIKNSTTKGYDQEFLSLQKVKDTCVDAVNDGYKMGYCDKSLGTL